MTDRQLLNEKITPSQVVSMTEAQDRMVFDKVPVVSLESEFDRQRQDLASQRVLENTLRKTWTIDSVSNGPGSYSDLKLISSTAVTQQFRKEVQKFFQAIPEPLRQLVASHGTQVLLVENAYELDENLAGLHLRRHPGNVRVGSLCAFYYARNNVMVFCERPDKVELERASKGQIMQSQKFLEQFSLLLYGKSTLAPLSNCGAHEFGHALDAALANFSHGPKFEEAFGKDILKVSDKEKGTLSYFTYADEAVPDPKNRFDAAKEEVFAEIFATSLGLGACPKKIDGLLGQKFHEVGNLIKATVDGIIQSKPSSKYF